MKIRTDEDYYLKFMTYPVYGSIAFILMTVAAMFFYPGGSGSDPYLNGYSFWSNFFSDLGRTVTPLHEPNTISFFLFTFAMLIIGIVMVLFFVAYPVLFKKRRATYLIAKTGSLFGIAAGLFFCGVGMTPVNEVTDVHNFFASAAFVSITAALFFYMVAIIFTKDYPKIYVFFIALLLMIMTVFIYIGVTGLTFGDHHQLTVGATAQKIVAYSIILTSLIVSDGARKYYKKSGLSSCPKNL